MKKNLFLVLAAFSVSLGCSNGSLLEPTPSQNGTMGNLLLKVQYTGDMNALNNQGYQLSLSQASIYWHSIGLEGGADPECNTTNPVSTDLAKIDQLLTSSLTILSTDLIPTTPFCQYEFIFGDSSETAELKFHGSAGDLPAVTLAGTWTKEGRSGSFSVSVENPLHVRGDFMANEDGELIDHPLHFHEGESSHEKIFYFDRTLLLKEINFESDSQTTMQQKVEASFAQVLTQ